MIFPKSMSRKVAAWHAIVFISILSLFSALLYVTFTDSLTKEVDAILAREGGRIAYYMENGHSFSEIEEHMNGLTVPAAVNTEEIYWQIENGQGKVIAASQNLHGQRISIIGPLKKADDNIVSWDPELNGMPLRAMTLPPISTNKLTYTITVAISDGIRHFAIDQLRNIMIFCNFGFVGISIVMGWLISKKTLQPIQKIITATNKITVKNLHERLPIEGPEDELQILSKTLNGMIDRLEISFAQIQQFTSDVSHELRTSLTIIRGEMDVALNRDRSAEEYKSVLHSALEEVIYLSDMAEKFLYLSAKNSNPNQIDLIKIDGTLLFRYVTNHLLSLAEQKQMELHVHIPNSFSLIGDEDLLRRLFINLIENAIKYSPEGGSVEMKASLINEFIRIEVTDHGIGIPEEHLPFIFQRFYRVDDSRTRSQGGSGLGLSLCKWIVDAHKGRIEIQSKAGQGTTVIIYMLAE